MFLFTFLVYLPIEKWYIFSHKYVNIKYFYIFFMCWTSDVYLKPVWSEFIWVRESGSGFRGLKLRKKQSLTNFFFKGNYIFQAWN